jgi:hypothetical protein
MDAMADRRLLVDGVPTSLIDLGYTRASVDGRYLACNPSTKTPCKYDCGGVNGSYHDERGWPVVNKTNFPDIKAMTAHAHSLNLSAGWYTNNFQQSSCESGWAKTHELMTLHMNGEAEFMKEMKFDEIKVPIHTRNQRLTNLSTFSPSPLFFSSVLLLFSSPLFFVLRWIPAAISTT